MWRTILMLAGSLAIITGCAQIEGTTESGVPDITQISVPGPATTGPQVTTP